MELNNSYKTTSDGYIRSITYVDLDKRCFTSVLYLYGEGEISRLTTEIPDRAFGFDELYEYHLSSLHHEIALHTKDLRLNEDGN